MRTDELYSLLDELAPKALSDAYCAKYGAYDNSGILLDAGYAAEKILFSLDLSFGALEEAAEKGCKIVVTHHPAIYAKIGNLCGGEPLHGTRDVLGTGQKLIRAVENGISVISMHLNLDCAPYGIDESLMRGVMLSAAVAAGKKAGEGSFAEARAEKCMHEVEAGGVRGAYGRVYGVESCAPADLADSLKKTLPAGQVCVYGDSKRKISRVASFCGAGADEEAVAFACGLGAEVIVSSDFKHHIVAAALEKGMSVIALTHYASENYGFEKFCREVKARSGAACIFHTDKALL